MTTRYYIRKQPDTYTIHDHKLRGTIIAHCDYREQATLVCKALNAWADLFRVKAVDMPPEAAP